MQICRLVRRFVSILASLPKRQTGKRCGLHCGDRGPNCSSQAWGMRLPAASAGSVPFRSAAGPATRPFGRICVVCTPEMGASRHGKSKLGANKTFSIRIGVSTRSHEAAKESSRGQAKRGPRSGANIFQARNGRQNGRIRSAAPSGLDGPCCRTGGSASLHPRL